MAAYNCSRTHRSTCLIPSPRSGVSIAVLFLGTALTCGLVEAQDANWLNPATVPGVVPGSFDYNAPANWSSAVVPIGTASFGPGTSSFLSFSGAATVGGWEFNTAGTAYRFAVNPNLTFNGTGIVTNGGLVNINVNVGSTLTFANTSSAGTATIDNDYNVEFNISSTGGSALINNGANGDLRFYLNSTAGNATIGNFGTIFFFDRSTAENATITNQGNLIFSGFSTAGSANIAHDLGVLQFQNFSTASNAIIRNASILSFSNNSSAGASVITNSITGAMTFNDDSTAGSANITNLGNLKFNQGSTASSATIINRGDNLRFNGNSTAGSATITNQGKLYFNDNSTGGNAAITNDGENAAVDISASSGPAGDNRLTAGSIAGAGSFRLGAKELTVGGNNQTTNISGVISGDGGSLVKDGAGTLTLSGANTYTGGTTVSAGTLQLGNGGTSGSIVGDVSNNGIFAINRSDAFSYGGVISGAGALQQNGTGTTTLTGANTYSGATNVNAGTLRAGALNTFSPGSAVTVANGGTLDLNGFNHTIVSIANAGRVSMGLGTAPGTVLTTPGYTGSGGTIAMNTVLGTDNSPSDKLVINTGSATGNSFLTIANAGGQGELTTGNGILVVDAVNGGTTSASAFAVKGIVAAGPYEYQLFRGGVGGASPNSWFLRNTVEAPVTPEPPVPPGTGTTPPVPTPPRPVIPLYRPEAALYTQLPGVARLLDLAMLSTFHKRQGDQSLLLGAGTLPGSWGRIFGGRAEEQRSGLLSPEIEGNLWGFQVGQDIFGWEHDGHRDRIGLFLGNDRADVDARGFALAQQRALVGNLKMDATSLAAYWTHVGPSNWYIDAVLMASWLDGNPRSTRGVDLNADGTGVTASLEAGYPIPIGAGLVFEPQVQLISQHVDFGRTQDSFATIRFDSDEALTGRIGARLVGEVVSDGVVSKPYLFVNVWHNFDGTDTTTFNATPIPTSFGRTSLEFGGVVSAQVSTRVGVYADVSYATNVGGEDGRAVMGNVGLRATW